MVKIILNKWVQYNTELQIFDNSFVKLTGSAGILDVHTKSHQKSRPGQASWLVRLVLETSLNKYI